MSRGLRSISAALAASAAALAFGAGNAQASTLGYQCGEGICTIDPDSRDPEPDRVVSDGRFAGVTADGKSIAWVQPSGELVTAPTAGGPPTTVYTEAVGIQPAISPDGEQFLWWFPGDGFVYINRLTVATGEVVGVSLCFCATTHGWLGTQGVAAFPSDPGPSRVCTVGAEEETGTSDSCARALVSDPRGELAFPDGSPDGSQIVAALQAGSAPAGSSGTGALALYSVQSGALIRDLTTNPNDAEPTFSPDGDRIAFARDGQIVVLDLASGQEHVVGPGVYPSWGGTPGSAGDRVEIPKQKLRYRKGKIKVKLACSAATLCAGKLVIRKGKKAKLAKGSYELAAGESGKAVAKTTRKGRALLKRTNKVKVTIELRPKGGGEPVTMKAKLRG